MLDGFDLDGGDGDGARPVVLLSAPKRPARPQTSQSSGSTGGTPGDFMQSLERRLAEDDE